MVAVLIMIRRTFLNVSFELNLIPNLGDLTIQLVVSFRVQSFKLVRLELIQ